MGDGQSMCSLTAREREAGQGREQGGARRGDGNDLDAVERGGALGERGAVDSKAERTERDVAGDLIGDALDLPAGPWRGGVGHNSDRVTTGKYPEARIDPVARTPPGVDVDVVEAGGKPANGVAPIVDTETVEVAHELLFVGIRGGNS